MHPPDVLVVPERGLVLLIGASGSGKTTFAQRHFRPTEVLSSDAFRALVADDEADQSATGAAFDLLERALAYRLRRGRLSVVDATNAKRPDRRALLRRAAAARRPAVAIVFDLPEAVCLERNAARTGRVVDPEIVRRHVAAVALTLRDPELLLAEGYAAVHVIDERRPAESVLVIRDPMLPRPPALPADVAPGRPPGAVDAHATDARVRSSSASRGRTA